MGGVNRNGNKKSFHVRSAILPLSFEENIVSNNFLQ